MIDKLVTEPQYDEALARSLCLNSPLNIGIGGYQEYCDIFKAAWAVNQSSAGKGRFGNVLFDQLGSRTFSIFPHSPCFPSEGGYDAPQLSLPCDGYICQGPLTDYEPVTPIPDFVNASNLALVRRRIFRDGLRDANRIYASSSGAE